MFEFFREDGARAVKVTSSGGWLDLQRRKLTIPPEELRRLIEQIPRVDSFQAL